MTILLYACNVLCSAGQSALSKQYARRDGDALTFNINKAVIGAVLFLAVGLIGGFSLHLPTILFAVGYGLALCFSMHTGFKALSIGPMALTSVIASFSLIIPFFFGICFWNETLTLSKALGIGLLLLSIWLINAKREQGFSLRWLCYALLTLLANGICSVLQKMHQLQFPTLYRNEFMFWAMLCVFLVLLVANTPKKPCITVFRFSLLGLVSGILNCLANYIVLYLSATGHASVIFPIVSVANIMAVWIIGILVFKEKLKPLQVVGLLLGIASVVMLKQ